MVCYEHRNSFALMRHDYTLWHSGTTNTKQKPIDINIVQQSCRFPVSPRDNKLPAYGIIQLPLPAYPLALRLLRPANLKLICNTIPAFVRNIVWPGWIILVGLGSGAERRNGNWFFEWMNYEKSMRGVQVDGNKRRHLKDWKEILQSEGESNVNHLRSIELKGI